VSGHSVPFYCPYCGDEDLAPYAERHGAWWCQSCRRAWSLSMIGIGTPGRGDIDAGTGGNSDEGPAEPT
jgi:hypothetical protein